MLYIYTIIAGNEVDARCLCPMESAHFCLFCSLQKPEYFVSTNTILATLSIVNELILDQDFFFHLPHRP